MGLFKSLKKAVKDVKKFVKKNGAVIGAVAGVASVLLTGGATLPLVGGKVLPGLIGKAGALFQKGSQIVGNVQESIGSAQNMFASVTGGAPVGVAPERYQVGVGGGPAVASDGGGVFKALAIVGLAAGGLYAVSKIFGGKS